MAGLCDLERTNGKMETLNGHHSTDYNSSCGLDVEETKNEIFQLTSFSSRLEKVLLALLRENVMVKDEIRKDKNLFLSTFKKLGDDLEKEKEDRIKTNNDMKSDLEANTVALDKTICKLNDELNDSLNTIKEAQDNDREKFASSLHDIREEFQDNLDQVKEDVVTEIKDNISLLSENITSLENAIHDDVNKLKNMMCDLGENVEEEKLLRIEAEKQVKDELTKTNDWMKESENKLLERLYDEEDRRMKDCDNLRNALEEEKLLRGQECEIMKKQVADASDNLTAQLNDHKSDINKLIEDEKDERANQHDDMLIKLDRERKERIKANDMLMNQLQDSVDDIVTKQMQDIQILQDNIDKQGDNIQSYKKDLENEMIKQGKEIFAELDKNKSEFESTLNSEARKRDAEKSKMYEDFEQVCRNIDDRITGEKEKLWDDLKSTKDELEEHKNHQESSTDFLKALIDEETSKNKEMSNNLLSQITEQKENGKNELDEIMKLIEVESSERKQEASNLSKKLEEDVSDCHATSRELKNYLDTENEKRRAEAEALQKKIQKEKDDLRSYIDNDNKALR